MKKLNLKRVLLITMIIVLLTGTTIFGTATIMRFGSDDANISIEQSGDSNLYDFCFNSPPTEEPILKLYDDIGGLGIYSFGERIISYSAIMDSLHIHKDVNLVDGFTVRGQRGITTKLELEQYTLVIVDGIIVEVK